MIRRTIWIGRWRCDFIFAPGGYEMDALLELLEEAGASQGVMAQAEKLLTRDQINSGFTYGNPDNRRIISVVGPTDSGAEFLDTFVHELRHAVNDIALSLGYDLAGETPAYASGDAVRELADIVCRLGCRHCRG